MKRDLVSTVKIKTVQNKVLSLFEKIYKSY